MTDNDTKKLADAYQLVLESTAKALTPEQIAKRAKPAGSSKGGTDLPSNKEGAKTEQPSSNDMENIDGDNKDTKVKDPYVLKEDGEEAVSNPESDVPKTDIQGENAAPAVNTEDIVYEAAMELTGTLEEINENLRSMDPKIGRSLRSELAMTLKRIVDDFKYGRLPHDLHLKQQATTA